MLDTFSKVSSLLYNNGIEDFNHTLLYIVHTALFSLSQFTGY